MAGVTAGWLCTQGCSDHMDMWPQHWPDLSFTLHGRISETFTVKSGCRFYLVTWPEWIQTHFPITKADEPHTTAFPQAFQHASN